MIILRKGYNFIYKYFLVCFSLGLYKILFEKKKITIKLSEGNFIKISEILSQPYVDRIFEMMNHENFVIIGKFDQKGNIVSEYPLQLKQPIRQKNPSPRNKFVIELVVLKDGAVVLKKTHKNYTIFFRELYAMISLSSTNIKIPAVFDYDIWKKFILMEFIDGYNMKKRLSVVGAEKELSKLKDSDFYSKASSIERYYMRTNIEKKFLVEILLDKQVSAIFADYEVMLKEKFIYQDIKYGNFIILKDEIYWIDFEHCKSHKFTSEELFDILSKPFLSKLKNHFPVVKFKNIFQPLV